MFIMIWIIHTFTHNEIKMFNALSTQQTLTDMLFIDKNK